MISLGFAPLIKIRTADRCKLTFLVFLYYVSKPLFAHSFAFNINSSKLVESYRYNGWSSCRSIIHYIHCLFNNTLSKHRF